MAVSGQIRKVDMVNYPMQTRIEKQRNGWFVTTPITFKNGKIVWVNTHIIPFKTKRDAASCVESALNLK